MKAIPTSSATAAASVSISNVLVLLDELDSVLAAPEVTVRTGTEGVGLVVPVGALPFCVPFGAVVEVAPVETFGVAAGAELVGTEVVGAGADVVGAVDGAGVVAGAVAVDTPGGGAKTAAPAPAGSASESRASPPRDILSAVA
jgi:hypothetical protein